MVDTIKKMLVPLMLLLVAGCGGEDAFTQTGASGGTGGGGGGTTAVRIGNGTGSSFTQGVLALGVSSLSAGGSTTVTTSLVDSSGSLYSTPVDVTFTSTCLASGQATLTSPVTTIGGLAISTYAAKGCSGSDTITATATVDGTSLSATGTVTVAAASIGSIQFDSVTPNTIAIKGTGGAGRTETATVIFKVLDETGGPVSGQDVTFSLDTTVGEITMTPPTAKSGVDGKVQTVVQAGTVQTSVKVKATLDSLGISTTSDSLVISTGLADQDSFSLSASMLSPEAWGYDNETVTITARLADRYNNSVPDGTAVAFTTEGGSVGDSCNTVNGACSVEWKSQNPRPCGQELGRPQYQAGPVMNQCLQSGSGNNPAGPQAQFNALGQPYGGRVTILATALGEESFTDNNGNGIFDSGDTFTDIPEAFRDDNENGVRDNGEIFVDYNKNEIYDATDGKFNGVLCEHPSNSNNPSPCSTSTSLHVRSSITIVMTDSTLYESVSPSSLTIPASTKQMASVSVLLSDFHNQKPPAGTVIEISKSNGTLESAASLTVPDSASSGPYSFTIKVSGDGTSSSGLVTIKATTPKGLINTFYVDVND